MEKQSKGYGVYLAVFWSMGFAVEYRCSPKMAMQSKRVRLIICSL